MNEESNTKIDAYLAGFIDGDGCLNAQIVRRNDYHLRFQIRVLISFHQKSHRHWFILWLAKQIPKGKIRKRRDGISEYILSGEHAVKPLLKRIYPFLQVKKAQAKLLLDIVHNLPTAKDPHSFLELCRSVDHFVELNDSKKRTITANVVKQTLEEEGFFVSP
jgi:hypothetical protein